MSQWKSPVFVMADDFTGANDVGSEFSSFGARVNVMFSNFAVNGTTNNDVLIVNTDSRALSSKEAYLVVKENYHLGQDFIEHGWIFKKIDSTLRGNIGIEIEAILNSTEKTIALVAPSVPKLGRVTKNGCCLLNGVLLSDTEFSSDPKTPVNNSRVLDIIEEQSSLQGAELTLEDVRSENLIEMINEISDSGIDFIVIDSDCEDDLGNIIFAASNIKLKPILVGASGLSEALAKSLVSPVILKNKEVKFKRLSKPILAVIGSMSEISISQVSYLMRFRILDLIDIDIEKCISHERSKYFFEIKTKALRALTKGRLCILRTCNDKSQRHNVDHLCLKYNYSRHQLSIEICDFLERLVFDVNSIIQLGGLYLSGGDIAYAISRKLNAKGFIIKGRVADCITFGYLVDSETRALVMTKSGGFGDKKTLFNLIKSIEGGISE